MKVRYTRPAATTLARILGHLSEQSPQGERNVQARIHSMIGLIAEYPHAGQATGRRGVRRVLVTPYPYLIFYRVVAGEVIIDAIRHAARSRHP